MRSTCATTGGAAGKLLKLLGAFALATAIVAGSPAAGEAQEGEVSDSQVSPAPEGMIGLGLVGAELGMIVPAIFGASDTWVYLVFPGVGLVGGGIAGIFLLQDGSFAPAGGAGEPEIAVGAFAVGLAGLIPALVVAMSATAYDPEDEVAMAAAARDAGPGLVRISPDGTFVGAPGVALKRTQDDPLGLSGERREVSVSVVSGRF